MCTCVCVCLCELVELNLVQSSLTKLHYQVLIVHWRFFTLTIYIGVCSLCFGLHPHITPLLLQFE